MLACLAPQRLSLAWLTLAGAAAGCGAPPTRPPAELLTDVEPLTLLRQAQHRPGTVELDRATIDAACVLPEGTIVRLLPVRGADESLQAGRAIAGLWRVALSQSRHLDIAADRTAAPAGTGVDLLLTLDAKAHVATATLQRGNDRTHLASVSLSAEALTASIDDLALLTRLHLGDPTPTAPIALSHAYSSDLELVAACESAFESARDGEFYRARTMLTSARRRDGACTQLLDGLASTQLLMGNAEQAERLATEALQFEHRLSAACIHRLLRTLLLARSSLQPRQSRQLDQQLLTLADVTRRERPHDPDPQLTAGIAWNFLGDFEAARTMLRQLVKRIPTNATAHYHLGWAELILGNGRRATAEFTEAAARLPIAVTIVPRALALFSAARHEELELLLVATADDGAIRNGPALHQLRRMQAAHALLRGQHELAGEVMLADLTWLLERPSLLRDRPGHLADIGEVLVRLGRGRQLRPLLRSIQRIDSGLALNHALGDATAYLLGLAEAASEGQRIRSVEDALMQRGATVWAHSLAAFGHRQRGELGEERAALTLVAQQSSSPLVKAALVRNLRATGQTVEATTLRDALRRELEAIDLRQRIRHPLLGPEYAMAWLVD